MKKIKIYLQYPWKFPDSPYYKYLIDNPPENVEYLNIKKQKGVITSKKFFWFSNFLKRNIRKFVVLFKLSIPNAHLTKTKQKFDLIHCAHCLSLNKGPWVGDFEGPWQFSVSGEYSQSGKRLMGRILKKENCKKIIAWTKAAKNNILKEFPETKGKVEMVYPAVFVPKIKKKKHKQINLLFVGRYFYAKGGLHALEVFDKLTKKYENVKAIIVSEIPKVVKEKYSRNKKIEFYGLIPQKELFDLYSKSDIFIYPGYSDSFGFMYLEAMGFGIPVITVDGFAKKEIISEGETGFVINRLEKINPKIIGPKEKQLINEIIKKADRLIKNKKLREKMSKNSVETIKKGRFSIKERNTKLEKIYEKALK